MKQLTAIICLLGLLVGCKSNQVLTTLEATVAAAEATVVILQTDNKISAETATIINSYLSGVSIAVEFAATELASSDSSEVKALKIGQNFAGVIATFKNLPPNVQLIVNAVNVAINSFLASINQPIPLVIKVSAKDMAKLQSIGNRAKAIRK